MNEKPVPEKMKLILEILEKILPTKGQTLMSILGEVDVDYDNRCMVWRFWISDESSREVVSEWSFSVEFLLDIRDAKEMEWVAGEIARQSKNGEAGFLWKSEMLESCPARKPIVRRYVPC